MYNIWSCSQLKLRSTFTLVISCMLTLLTFALRMPISTLRILMVKLRIPTYADTCVTYVYTTHFGSCTLALHILSSLRLPLATLHVDAQTILSGITAASGRDKSHPFFLKKLALLIWTAESKTGSQRSIAKNNAVTRYYAWLWITMQRKTNKTRVPRLTQQCRNLPVSSNLALRYSAHYFINLLLKRTLKL